MTENGRFSLDYLPRPSRALPKIPLHRKIRTGEKQVAWSGVFMLSMMWFTWGFNIFAGGVALTFTIRKYSNDPRVISFVTTLSGLIMLGPIISYLSDQIWTPKGRRKPFLVIAWLGGFLAMLSFAFLPAIAGVINHGLIAIHIYPVGELLILAVVIACYKKMWDGASPLEPLFLECVPPHQRGRFWAIRNMLFSLAVMVFYQILWPMYDRNVDMLGWMWLPGRLYMSGEQSIYVLAAGLFFFTGIFVVFCVEEAKVETAPNRPLADFLKSDPTADLLTTGDLLHLVYLSWIVTTLLLGIDILLQYKGIAYGLVKVVCLVPALFALRLVLLSQPAIVFFSRQAIGRFIYDFLRNVLTRRENFPYYIVLIIPGIEALVWGNYNALMQNDLFHYSKQAQANWAYPMQLFAIIVLPPFAGWYSDIRVTIRWWLRIIMLIASAASFIAMLRVIKVYSPEDIRAVPGFMVLFVVTALATFSMMLLYIPMVETMLDYVGREHARAWVSLLTVVKSMCTTGLLYLFLRHAAEQTLPIMQWMVFAVIGSALNAMMDTFIGPMIFDYMPRNQMGTINAGKGLIDGFVTFCAANLGAWWIVYFTNHIHKPTNAKYDYTSMYILQFILFVPAIIAKLYFIGLIRSGKMKKWGTFEVERAKEIELVEEKLAMVPASGIQ